MNQQKLWKKKWAETSIFPPNNFAKRVFTLIRNKGYKNLLDLGCGLGQDSIYFAKKGLQVTAVDFSVAGLDKISASIKNLKVVEQGMSKLKFKPNSFDVIYAHLSLHYFDDKTTTKIFNKLYSILKSKGMLFIKCKSTDDFLFDKGKKIELNMYLRKGHIRHFFDKEYMQKNYQSSKLLRLEELPLFIIVTRLLILKR